MVQITEVSHDTIVALSSGQLPSGVAIIRVSGPACDLLENAVFRSSLPVRKAVLRHLYNSSNELLDEVLALKFAEGKSFTGEPCLEIHAHGGRAVVSAILDELCSHPNIRLADAGEFTRRAFENGRLDLTEVDGIADLISSETESQRKLALDQTQGKLRSLYEGWRQELIHIRAMIEAEFDFSDEEDVPTDISAAGFERLNALIDSISKHLDDNRAGEIIRDGFSVAIMGKPNSGKSSLLNALVKRDAAIVSDRAGTTRDVIEVRLDLNGYEVRLFDTAGIRSTNESVEAEGIRRAHSIADESDLVIWLTAQGEDEDLGYKGTTPVLPIRSKDDLLEFSENSISVKHSDGLNWLLRALSDQLDELTSLGDGLLISRKRYRDQIAKALDYLVSASRPAAIDMELRADDLRLAGDCIGRVTGVVDVEDLLDVIFAEFCVGK